MSEKISIDVWSDIVCPWCYVGREHLVRAIRNLGIEDDVHIIHHAYQLDPLRTDSEPLTVYLSKKFGAKHHEMTSRVEAKGADVGLTLNFARGIAANSRKGHRLVHLATRSGRGDAMLERLMRAHFTDGLDIADLETLSRLANEMRLPDDEVTRTLSDGYHDGAVQADIDVARDLGIRGVPFFVFNRRFAVSGAQPVDVFEEALKQARTMVTASTEDPNLEPAT